MPAGSENQIQGEALISPKKLPLDIRTHPRSARVSTPYKLQNFFKFRNFKIFSGELFLFCLTLGLGIAAAFSLQGIISKEQISLPEISFWDFISGFALASLFILFLSRLPRLQRGKGTIYRFLFLIITWWAGAMLISIWIPGFVALILMAGLVFWRWKSPSVLNHNLCMILGLAGMGSNLGIALDPWIVIILLIVFSIYDFIAVYKTKHMQKMAEEMAAHGAIFAFIVPQKIAEFRQSLKEVKPGGKFLILGGGDIAFPLLLCASLAPTGILNPLIVAIFSVIGLGVSFWIFISQKVRQPIPALPPIALFSIIGFLLSFLF